MKAYRFYLLAVFALTMLIVGLIGWQLCFEASGFGGWLPFGMLVVAPVLSWVLRGLFDLSHAV